MKNERLNERKRKVRTAVGLAAIDGVKPSNFTKYCSEIMKRCGFSQKS